MNNFHAYLQRFTYTSFWLNSNPDFHVGGGGGGVEG